MSIKAALNKGLSDNLSAAFPNIIPASISTIIKGNEKIPDLHWLAGFTDAEDVFL